MGLISFVLLVVLTLVYLSKGLDKKPELLDKAVAKINVHINEIAFWGLLYGLVAFILTPMMMAGNGTGLIIRLLANLMIVFLALPFCIDRILAKVGLNETVAGEIKNAFSWITRQEKIMGYVAAVVSLLLFAVVFR